MGLTLLPSFGKLLENLEYQNAWESFFDNSSTDCFDTIQMNCIENKTILREHQLFLKLKSFDLINYYHVWKNIFKWSLEMISFGAEKWIYRMLLVLLVNPNAPIMVCSKLVIWFKVIFFFFIDCKYNAFKIDFLKLCLYI